MKEYTPLQRQAIEIFNDLKVSEQVPTRLLAPWQMEVLDKAGLHLEMTSTNKQRSYKCYVYVEGRA